MPPGLCEDRVGAALSGCPKKAEKLGLRGGKSQRAPTRAQE